MIILGIDPGTTRIGFGVIEFIAKNKTPKIIECGLLKIIEKKPNDRIREASSHFLHILNIHKPNLLAIEKLFFMNNQKTGISVAEMRGGLIMLAVNAGLEIKEYAPTEIKRFVTGIGNAPKQQVKKMVEYSLKLKSIPGPDDVSDALAISLAAYYDFSSIK